MDTSFSGFTAGPSSGSLQPLRDRNPARVQFAAGLPEERSGVDFGTRSQSLPTNPAFFPDMLAQDLTGELGKKKGKSERGGKNSPRAGGRYCMHVLSSTRFVASCLRIFLGSQDYPQSQ